MNSVECLPIGVAAAVLNAAESQLHLETVLAVR
jgi:hypothetical protein